MKKILTLVALLGLFMSCSDDDNEVAQSNIQLNFTHNWEGTAVTNADFNSIQYTNANGEQLSIERLRYLISKVTLTNLNGGTIVFDDYNLVDVTTNANLVFAPTQTVPVGQYNLSFTFGFNNDDNIDGAYTDLNSASWNVPAILGGGYHYMQFDGKYLDNSNAEAGFNYHAIRAVDNPGPNPTFPQDTFFNVDLGNITVNNDLTVEVKMDISEWFKNPNTWDLNVFNTVLMPNSTAQIMMYENGQSVFSLVAITQ